MLAVLAPFLGFGCSHEVTAADENIQTTSAFLDLLTLPTRGHLDGGLTRSGSHYYFGSEEEATAGLWRTDGTTLGTVCLNERAAASFKVGASPHLFFWVGRDLWRTDGVPHQEVLIEEGFGSPPMQMTRLSQDSMAGSTGSTA